MFKDEYMLFRVTQALFLVDDVVEEPPKLLVPCFTLFGQKSTSDGRRVNLASVAVCGSQKDKLHGLTKCRRKK